MVEETLIIQNHQEIINLLQRVKTIALIGRLGKSASSQF